MPTDSDDGEGHKDGHVETPAHSSGTTPRPPESFSKACSTESESQSDVEDDEDDAENEHDQPEQVSGKKRGRKPESWKRNVRKRQRNSGEAYTTVKGTQRAEKTLRPPSCADKCYTMIDNREALFSHFNSLGSYDLQNMYLLGMIGPIASNIKEGLQRQKYRYDINEKGVQKQVCREEFLSIFGINKFRLERILKAVKSGNPNDVLDKRGKHVKKAITTEERDTVKHHIEKFLLSQSHYSRKKNPNWSYLSPTLNLHTMYKLYKDETENPVKEWLYRDIFLHEFNLSFGPPRSDACIGDWNESTS